MSNLSVVPGVLEVNISWNPPSECNGVIVTYEVAFSTDSDMQNFDNTSDTQYTLRDLPPKTSVFIAVRAYTMIGTGDFSPANTGTLLVRKSLK